MRGVGTLRARLVAAFVLVVLVPLAVGAALVARGQGDDARSRQDEGLASTARATAALLTASCERLLAVAESAARADPAAAQPVLDQLVARGLADGVRLTSASGADVAVAGAPAAAGATCADGVLAGSVPLQDSAGRAAGQATASLSVDDGLAARLRAAAGTGPVVLLGPDGSRAGAAGQVPAALLDAAAARPGQVVRTGGLAATVVPAGQDRPLGLLLAVEARSPRPLLVPALLVLGGAAVVAAALALLLARAVTRPLEELAVAAGRVAAGDLETSIDVRSRDEVGRLASSFNVMTGELRSRRDELQAGLDRLGETLSSTHDLDSLLAVVLETAVTAVRARAGVLLLVDRQGSALRPVAAYGLPLDRDLRVPLGAGVAGRVAVTGEASGTGRDLVPAPGEPGAFTRLALPMRGAGQVLGVLDLLDREDGLPFDEADVAALRAFAGQAAVAVDNVRQHESAQRYAVTDALTGLANRRQLAAETAREVDRAGRSGAPLAMLLLDLDDFKRVNDTHGHSRGDEVLVELAARVRSAVRGEVDTVARYGGEELVVLLPDTDADGAARAAERVVEAVRATGFRGQPSLSLTVSVGVAVHPDHAVTASTLFEAADRAMYEAKRSGKNAWRLATAPL